MNLRVRKSFSVSVLTSLRKILRSAIAESYGICFKFFKGPSILFSTVVSPINIPMNSEQEFPFSVSSPAFVTSCSFDNHHSEGWDEVSLRFWFAFPWLMMLSTFSCTCLESVFLGKILFIPFAHFLNWRFFPIELYEFFMCFGYEPLISNLSCKYFLLVGCLFILLMVFFGAQSFLVWCGPTCLFLFLLLFSCYIQKESQPRLMSSCLPMILPSGSFMVSGFMFKSLIHFDFIFMYGAK